MATLDGMPQGLSATNTSPHPPQPAATPTWENDRQKGVGEHQGLVPLFCSSQHQRTFKTRAARLWNLFTVVTPEVTNVCASVNDWFLASLWCCKVK